MGSRLYAGAFRGFSCPPLANSVLHQGIPSSPRYKGEQDVFSPPPLSNIKEITERDRAFGKMLLNASLSLFLLARITFFRARNNRFPCTILPVSIEGHERREEFRVDSRKSLERGLNKSFTVEESATMGRRERQGEGNDENGERERERDDLTRMSLIFCLLSTRVSA